MPISIGTTHAGRDVATMFRALRSRLYIWCVEQLARFDNVATSVPFRAARAVTLALALIYAGLTLSHAAKQYGVNTDASMATAGTLNSDAYDMGAAITGALGLTGPQLAARPMQYILLCGPEKFTQAQATEIDKLHRSVAAQLRRHAGATFLAVKHAVEGGYPHIALQITPTPIDPITIRYGDTPQELRCDPSYGELERFPASIYYDPKIEDLKS